MPGKRSASVRRTLNVRAIAVLALIAVLAAVAVGALINRGNSKLQPLPFSPNSQYQFLNSGVLYIESNLLHYDDLARGKSNWSLRLTGEGFRISASETIIVVYNDKIIQALGNDGASLFPGLEFTSTVLDVRCGIGFIAVLRRDASGRYAVSIIEKSGKQLEPLTFDDSTPVDFNFYSQADKLWTLALDTSGAMPVSTLTTYMTGEAITGIMPIESETVELVHISDKYLYAIGTFTLHAFSSTGNEDASKQVYGWKAVDCLSYDSRNYFLLRPRNAPDDRSSNAKLITLPEDGHDVSLRFPPGYVGAFLFQDKLVVLTSDTEFSYDFKGNLLGQYPLEATIRSAKKLPGNRLLLISDNALYQTAIH